MIVAFPEAWPVRPLRILPLLAFAQLAFTLVAGASAVPRDLPADPLEFVARAGADPRGDILDVRIAELYGLTTMSRDGTYPTGISGLSAATTSCNVGTVDVPWIAAMDERHPCIGLAMYREENGRLEQIGRNWLKHGFFSLNDDDCSTCPNPAGGSVLRVACSDTYSANNNGNQYDLGPREEVNPHTGEWTACGSFFDEPVTPDADCSRDWFGFPGTVEQQLAVKDADLGHAGATYFYEGMYVVADDDFLPNNIGHRRLSSMTWNGAQWLFTTFVEEPPFVQEAQPGPVVSAWGDYTSSGPVAVGDGLFFLSVDVTDLQDGWWRYEYALYNRTSARGVRSFSVPTAGASIRNLTFRDPDDDTGNDWTLDASGVLVTASTDEWSVDPDANALEYQVLYNVGFEADRDAAETSATGGLFRPGTGVSFVLPTLGPGGVTDAPLASGSPGLRLELAGRNPSRDGADIRFQLPAEAPVQLAVRDVAGRRVRTLLDGRAPAGRSTLHWDGRDDAGRTTAAGIYFIRLHTPQASRTIKITRLP